jgi:hypothetical protein
MVYFCAFFTASVVGTSVDGLIKLPKAFCKLNKMVEFLLGF